MLIHPELPKLEWTESWETWQFKPKYNIPSMAIDYYNHKVLVHCILKYHYLDQKYQVQVVQYKR